MMKTSLFSPVFSIFFFSFHWCAAKPGLITRYALDTIPVGEYFDAPFQSPGVVDTVAEQFFSGRAGASKVIPIEALSSDSAQIELMEIPDGYTGFKIEIMSSPQELPGAHDIFFQHGNITLEVLEEGTHSYLIGDFRYFRKAEAFRATMYEQRYPDSKVIQYVEGVRQP